MAEITEPENAVDAARVFAAAKCPVVLFCNGLGDHLLALPALRALCRETQGQFALICRTGMPRWFFFELRIAHIIETQIVPTPHGSGYAFDARGVAAMTGDCDFLVDLNTWCSDSTLQLLESFGHPPVLGLNRDYTWHFAEAHVLHAARFSFNIVRCLNPLLELEHFSQPPTFDPRFVRRAERIRALCPSNRPYLAIHTETLPLKEWPIDYWHELLGLFLDAHPEWLVWVLDSRPRDLRRGRHEQRIIPLSGYSVPTVSLVLAHAHLFVGIDSVFLHVADSYRVPGIGLFGPMSPEMWGFLWSRALHLSAMPMSSLSPSVVFASVEALLASPAEATVLPGHCVSAI